MTVHQPWLPRTCLLPPGRQWSLSRLLSLSWDPNKAHGDPSTPRGGRVPVSPSSRWAACPALATCACLSGYQGAQHWCRAICASRWTPSPAAASLWLPASKHAALSVMASYCSQATCSSCCLRRPGEGAAARQIPSFDMTLLRRVTCHVSWQPLMSAHAGLSRSMTQHQSLPPSCQAVAVDNPVPQDWAAAQPGSPACSLPIYSCCSHCLLCRSGHPLGLSHLHSTARTVSSLGSIREGSTSTRPSTPVEVANQVSSPFGFARQVSSPGRSSDKLLMTQCCIAWGFPDDLPLRLCWASPIYGLGLTALFSIIFCGSQPLGCCDGAMLSAPCPCCLLTASCSCKGVVSGAKSLLAGRFEALT